jgi:hypothetical protein
MSYKRPPTQRYHKVATSTWADQLAQNFEALWASKPNVRLYKSTSTNITTGTPTAISWNAARWNVGTSWTSGAAITVPVAGFYLIYAHIDWEANTTGKRRISVGDHANVEVPSHDGFCTNSLCVVRYCAKGEQLSLFCEQDSGSTLTIGAGTSTIHERQDFGLVYLGGADYGI